MTFSERVEVIRRARSLDMDPDEYAWAVNVWKHFCHSGHYGTNHDSKCRRFKVTVTQSRIDRLRRWLTPRDAA